MQKRSSNSAAAGKWVISSAKECSLEDLPDSINPEDLLQSKKNHRQQNSKQTKKVKKYIIRSEKREATQEEYRTLTDSMKRECDGKTLIVSSQKVVDEEEYQKSRHFSVIKNLTSTSDADMDPDDCNDVFQGCATIGEN